jgi:uncharacterized protein
MFILLLQRQTLSATKQISFIEGFLSHVSMDFNAPLTSEELRQLEALMEEQGGMRLPRLHGYLTAVISGPALLSPDDWLPIIWEGKESAIQHPQFSSSMDGIRRLYNSIRACLEEGRPLLFCKETPLPSALLDKAAMVQWCQGYHEGAAFTAKIWALPEHKEARTLLLAIAVTGSDDATVKEGVSPLMEKAALEAFQGVRPEELPRIIGAIDAYWSAAAERPRYRIEAARHRLCPCGSGKEFDICCCPRTLH